MKINRIWESISFSFWVSEPLTSSKLNHAQVEENLSIRTQMHSHIRTNTYMCTRICHYSKRIFQQVINTSSWIWYSIDTRNLVMSTTQKKPPTFLMIATNEEDAILQLNQTSGQLWICKMISSYFAYDVYFYVKIDQYWTCIYCYKVIFILIDNMSTNIKFILRNHISYSTIFSSFNICKYVQIIDEWNLQVTKHLLFKQIQSKKEVFSQNCVYSFPFERRFYYKRFSMQPCNFLEAIFSPLRIWNQKRQYNDSKYNNNRSKLCTILFSFIHFFTFCV